MQSTQKIEKAVHACAHDLGLVREDTAVCAHSRDVRRRIPTDLALLLSLPPLTDKMNVYVVDIRGLALDEQPSTFIR